MKTTDEIQNPIWANLELVQRLREKLHDRIAHEELESSWRLEASDRLVDLLQMEPKTFHQLWLEPLLTAGATMEVAIASITASYLMPN